MPRGDRTLAAMRRNPHGDLRIEAIEGVCRRHGLTCAAPRRGDHYKVSHPAAVDILTIPARRPIKAVYVRKPVAMIDAVTGGRGEKDGR